MAVEAEWEKSLRPNCTLLVARTWREGEFSLPKVEVQRLVTNELGFGVLPAWEPLDAYESEVYVWANLEEAWTLHRGRGWWRAGEDEEQRDGWPILCLLQAEEQRFSFALRLRDEQDSPVSGARVRLCLTDNLLHLDHMPSGETDAYGDFAVRDLSSQDWNFEVVAPGFAPVVFRPTLRQNEVFPSGHDRIVLHPARELDVRFEGDRADEVEALYYRWSPDVWEGDRKALFTPVKDARARLSVPRKGKLTLCVERRGRFDVQVERSLADLPAGETLVVRVE